jgi:3-oxoadipate enol-lactonase
VPFAIGSDGTRIHYRTFGDPDAEPLLMLHGLGTDNSGWLLQRRAFGKHYSCIAVDNRGTGRSDKPHGAYRLEQMADDAAAVLAHAGVSSAHVMGASMGGVLSQILAVSRPEMVRSLVLACTACRMQPWRRELFENWIELAQARGMRAFAVHNLNWLIGPRSMRRLWPVAQVVAPLVIRAPVHGFVGQCRALLAVDEGWSARLEAIDVPTLVIVGSQDILTPVADSELLASSIPGAKLAVVRGGAHGFMVEHAATFNETVLSFLDDAVTRRASRRRTLRVVGNDRRITEPQRRPSR